MDLRIGYEVKRKNDNHGNFKVGDTGIVKSIKDTSYCNGCGCDGMHAVLIGDIGGLSHCKSNLEVISTQATKHIHKIGTIFSVLNEKEAESYIGRMVEFCDNDEYRDGKPWKQGVFEKYRYETSDFPFVIRGKNYYHLIRLIPESFESPKPKVDPGLIEALKKSVQQWQIMHDTGKSKYEVYKFLGGSSLDMACFLCNLFGVVGGGGAHKCRKCIDWKARYCHDGGNSPFEKYRTDPDSKPAISGVLNHLKSELVRLESLSK